MTFKGSMVAIVTPFKNGKIDEPALRALIEWQIKSGTAAIVSCGTTGEAATLAPEEREKITHLAVEQSSGRIPVIAGAGSNSTDTAIKLSKDAMKAGADGLLHVTPYYNKPTQEGLFRHFLAISEMVDIPIILYNVPSRTGVNMKAETVLRLSSCKNIVGVKEASGDISQICQIISGAPKDFCIFSGEDAQNLEIYRAGGKGAISVTANVAPEKVALVWDLHISGNADGALKLQTEIQDLNKSMFIETNPIPAKTALFLMGKIHEEFRLPMTPMSGENREKLTQVLSKYGLTK